MSNETDESDYSSCACYEFSLQNTPVQTNDQELCDDYLSCQFVDEACSNDKFLDVTKFLPFNVASPMSIHLDSDPEASNEPNFPIRAVHESGSDHPRRKSSPEKSSDIQRRRSCKSTYSCPLMYVLIFFSLSARIIKHAEKLSYDFPFKRKNNSRIKQNQDVTRFRIRKKRRTANHQDHLYTKAPKFEYPSRLTKLTVDSKTKSELKQFEKLLLELECLTTPKLDFPTSYECSELYFKNVQNTNLFICEMTNIESTRALLDEISLLEKSSNVPIMVVHPYQIDLDNLEFFFGSLAKTESLFLSLIILVFIPAYLKEFVTKYINCVNIIFKSSCKIGAKFIFLTPSTFPTNTFVDKSIMSPAFNSFGTQDYNIIFHNIFDSLYDHLCKDNKIPNEQDILNYCIHVFNKKKLNKWT